MRTTMRLLSAAAILAFGLAFPAIARDLTDDESASLDQAVADFNTAMTNADYATVVGTIPPKVIADMAATAGIGEDELVAAVIDQIGQVMATVTIVSFGMDMENAETKELPDGTPYLLIPTETVMDLGAAGGKMKANSPTLALLDEDTWYLVSVSDQQQVTILRKVYPEFSGEEFPAGTMEAVTE